ncbi:MAG: ATP-binding protein, partial [Theionarchaea archaeon]|nr:ATP-binding protein [Theionarchaea archaeon]
LKHGKTVTKIRLYYQIKNSNLNLVYEDDGEGISTSEKEKIFLEGYGKDTGYGLYIIRKICETYRWIVKETGDHSKGVQFTMVIPSIRNGNPGFLLPASDE